MKIDYTLWNTTGESITIPDGVTTHWPAGDALVGNFIYNQGKLAGFVNTSALVANSSKSTTFPYDYVNITVDKSLEGVMTFNPGERTKYFTVTYSESGNSGDTITFKYKGCKTVEDVMAVDTKYKTNDLVDGVWSESLADLEIGARNIWSAGTYKKVGLFKNYTNLIVFNGNLSSLTEGYYMFESCSNLTTFTSNLSSLTTGVYMFSGCSELTSFTSDLSSLTNGWHMFSDCKLDTASVKNIAETINTVSTKPDIYIGIGNTTPTTEENTYLTQIHNKGWQVYVNGSSSAYAPATATTDETCETQEAPIPFWAKPVPATEETAKYVDADGNFYNILGAQFIYVDDPDTYGMFINEEDAAAQMRLKKIGEEEIETA